MDKTKEQEAIQRLKTFAPKDGDSYFLCYSGGKDSDAIRILAQLADVPHEIHHNLTTVDAPETIAYIKTIPGVTIDKAHWNDGRPKTMWNLIPHKLMPPTRLVRYCCAHLKEIGGKGRLKITGVRWAESNARRESADVIRMQGKPLTTQKKLEEMGLPYRVTRAGGIVLNAQTGDNEVLKDKTDFLHQCYRDRSTTINPIVDWTDDDVWEFLRHYGCEGNPLYQCGDTRIGCIGCPMAGGKRQAQELAAYPKYAKNYIRAFDKMLKERARKGKETTAMWKNGMDVMRWWTQGHIDETALFEDDDEFYWAMKELSE